MTDDYDIVVDTLQSKYDELFRMNEPNLNIGKFNIMDQIRYEHMDTLNKAIKLWKEHQGK